MRYHLKAIFGEAAGIRRHGRRRIVFATAFTGAILAACAAPQAATSGIGKSPLEISQSTNRALAKYFDLVNHTRRGAFAVSLDGTNSYAYYCPEISCTSNLFAGVATHQCQSLSGQECVVLFNARNPSLAYSVSTKPGASGRHGMRRGIPLSETNAFSR